MTKLELYQQALSILDLDIKSLDEDTKEKRLLDLNYNKVIQFVLKLYDFPFLVKKAILDDVVDDNWKYEFGYTLPNDFGSVVQLNGSKDNPFSVRFGALWTDLPEPLLEYMPDNLEVSEGKYVAPDDFMALIAYQLALHVAPILDPESQSMGNAAQLFQLTFQSIIENDVRSNDRPLKYEASELLGNSQELSLAEYRRMLFEAKR